MTRDTIRLQLCDLLTRTASDALHLLDVFLRDRRFEL